VLRHATDLESVRTYGGTAEMRQPVLGEASPGSTFRMMPVSACQLWLKKVSEPRRLSASTIV
jgi:hypothetical protein